MSDEQTQQTPEQQKRARVLLLDNRQGVAHEIADRMAEDVVIGAVLSEPRHYLELSELLQAADFVQEVNAFAWHVMEKLFDEDRPIEVLSVADAMKSHMEHLGRDTLIEALNNCRAVVPQNSDPLTYAYKVQDNAERIRILNVCQKTITDCRDKGIDNEALKDGHETALASSYTQNSHDNPVAASRVEQFKTLIEFGDGVRYTNVGFDCWQTRSKRATILAGFSGTGKTTLLLSMARNVANAGGVVLLFIGEQDPVTEIMREFIAQESGVWRKKLDKRVPMTDLDKQLFAEAIQAITGWDLLIFGTNDLKRFSPAAMKRKIKKAIREYGRIDFVGIDGLWLMDSDGITDRRDDWQIIQENNRKINRMANDLDVPILMTHQYNSDYKNANKPELTMLQAGQRIHNDIPEALALWRKHDDVLLYDLKRRGGMVNKDPWKLRYNTQFARYEYEAGGNEDEQIDVPF